MRSHSLNPSIRQSLELLRPLPSSPRLRVVRNLKFADPPEPYDKILMHLGRTGCLRLFPIEHRCGWKLNFWQESKQQRCRVMILSMVGGCFLFRKGPTRGLRGLFRFNGKSMIMRYQEISWDYAHWLSFLIMFRVSIIIAGEPGCFPMVFVEFSWALHSICFKSCVHQLCRSGHYSIQRCEHGRTASWHPVF